MKEFLERNKEIILPALLFLIVLVVFGRMVSNYFVYDDILISTNRTIQGIINPFYYFSEPNALTTDFPEMHGDVYRPLGTWFFAIEYRLFGLDPFYYHLISLFLHGINTILLFFLFKKILSIVRPNSSPASAGKNDFLAFFGSLIFAVHPITTEVVAWAYQQNSLWSWFFILLALHILLTKERGENILLNKDWKRILLLTILSFLAVFFKEHGVVLPFLYVLCVLALKRGFIKKAGEIAAVALPVIFYLALRHAIAGTFNQIALTQIWPEGRYVMYLTMFKGFAYYFRLLGWPWPLSVNYDSFPRPESFKDLYVIASVVFLFLIISAAIFFWKKRPLFSLGIFWIFIVLGPVSNFIFITKQIISERFLYFAIPGFMLAVFSIAGFIKEKMENFPPQPETGQPQAEKADQPMADKFKKFLFPSSLFLVISIALIFSVLTFIRLADWKNNTSLWGHEIEIKRNDWRSLINYGVNLEKENRTEEAIEYYKKYLATFPAEKGVNDAVDKLATAYIRIGETNKAETLILKALKHIPGDKVITYRLGKIYLEKKEYGKVAETYKNPIWDNTSGSLIYFFTALAKKLNAETDEQIRAGIEDIENPILREAAFPLIEGRQKMLENKCEEAIVVLENTLTTYHPLPLDDPYVWLGQCFEKTGEKEKALRTYRLLLTLNPHSIASMIDACQGILRNGGKIEETF